MRKRIRARRNNFSATTFATADPEAAGRRRDNQDQPLKRHVARQSPPRHRRSSSSRPPDYNASSGYWAAIRPLFENGAWRLPSRRVRAEDSPRRSEHRQSPAQARGHGCSKRSLPPANLSAPAPRPNYSWPLDRLDFSEVLPAIAESQKLDHLFARALHLN